MAVLLFFVIHTIQLYPQTYTTGYMNHVIHSDKITQIYCILHVQEHKTVKKKKCLTS